jgi:hypothetical protein
VSDLPEKGSPEWIKAEQAKTPRPGRNGCLGCLGVVVAIFVVSGIFVWSSSQGNDVPDPARDRYEAIAQCEELVTNQLKAPTTAEFETAATVSGGEWTVTGSVASENSFGAMLTMNFECAVTVHEDSVTRQLISLS